MIQSLNLSIKTPWCRPVESIDATEAAASVVVHSSRLGKSCLSEHRTINNTKLPWEAILNT